MKLATRLYAVFALCALWTLVATPSVAQESEQKLSLPELLARIDAQDLPAEYEPGPKHQVYIDRVHATLTDDQRSRIGELFNAKRRLDRNIRNLGTTYVRIMHFVATGEKVAALPIPRPLPENAKVRTRPRPHRQPLAEEALGKPAKTGTIAGTVVGADGQAMAGVMVTAYDEQREQHTTVLSQMDGTFAIDGLRDTFYQLRARLMGQRDEWQDDVEMGDSVEFVMTPAEGEELEDQRPASGALAMLPWDNIRDKENFKMMCSYCHQVGTIGFRTPEKPVDWHTMLMRMDGFGGLYRHTQKTIVDRLIRTYKDDAINKWPTFQPPPAPRGIALAAKITEWDVGKRFQAMVHDIEPGPDGLMYAVDMAQNAIVTLDPTTGQRIVYRMPDGSGGPHSIELANDGNMWVTLCATGEMAKFDLQTKEITVYSSAEAPASRGSYPHTLRINPADPTGLVWYTDAGANSCFSIHPQTGAVKQYRLLKKDQAVAAGKGESRGITPYGLDYSPVDGSIWYSKLNGNRIGRIDPNAPDGDIKEWNPPFRGPRRLHIAQDGIVWVPGFGSGVFGKFDPKTEEWTVYPLPDFENQIPYALNIDPQGFVWICGTGCDSLFRFNPKSERLVEFRLPTRVTYTREIEFDDDGNIWTCSSNGPTRHVERGRGSVIKLELNDVGHEDDGIQLKPIQLPHHQVVYQKKIAWEKSPHGKILQHIDQQDAPTEYPGGGKQHQQYVDREMGKMTKQQRERAGQLYHAWRQLDPDMGNAGVNFVKVLNFVALGEPLGKTAAKSPSNEKLSDEELLTRIDAGAAPAGYHGATHQKFVDRVLADMTDKQKHRLFILWTAMQKRKPKNPGLSFVKILMYVVNGEKLNGKADPAPAKKNQATDKKETGHSKPKNVVRRKFAAQTIDPDGQNWHQWRGPEANGVSRTAQPPTTWSDTENIRWKVTLPGQGNSTPIIWQDKVFILTAINTERVDPSRPKPEDQPKRVFGIKHPNTYYQFAVLCLDRNTGKELWREVANEIVPHEGTHHDADFASASPTTDGQRLYCWFGSAGLFCYDLNGKKLWSRDLGKAYIGASLGEGCSPVLHNGRLVVVRDNARQSSIVVLDAKSGETLWTHDRDEPNAWATPRIIDHEGKTQVITAASKKVRSYDLDSGEIIWECSGLTGNVTPCPVIEGDVVFCMSGYQGYSLLALPINAHGDISDSDKILWSKRRGTPYVPSPLLYDGYLYFSQSNEAILSCLATKTGDDVFGRTRLQGLSNIYASPVGAAGRVYITGRNGATLVMKRSPDKEVLATNKLGETVNASPAIAGKQIFIRSRQSLFCIEELTP